jgi:glycosyltransferase involved in cell wall biosynthesis
VADTLVFIPAWNEEASLPAVLADARAELPDVDLLVIDDGSTDGTAAVARAGGADVVSFPRNRGLKVGIAEGYRQALKRGYACCGRLDADGQHPAAELRGMLELVRSGACDVAIGSRFLPESGKDGQRYRPAPERVVGTSHMHQREHGESSFHGKRAAELVVTIGLTLFAAGLLRRRNQHRRRRELARVLRPGRSRMTPW